MDATFDKVKPLVVKACRPIVAAYQELNQEMLVEQAEVDPHMLRHGYGYKLVNDGHDTRSIQHYLGHKNIQHVVRYTELSSDCFSDF